MLDKLLTDTWTLCYRSAKLCPQPSFRSIFKLLFWSGAEEAQADVHRSNELYRIRQNAESKEGSALSSPNIGRSRTLYNLDFQPHRSNHPNRRPHCTTAPPCPKLDIVYAKHGGSRAVERACESVYPVPFQQWMRSSAKHQPKTPKLHKPWKRPSSRGKMPDVGNGNTEEQVQCKRR